MQLVVGGVETVTQPNSQHGGWWIQWAIGIVATFKVTYWRESEWTTNERDGFMIIHRPPMYAAE